MIELDDRLRFRGKDFARAAIRVNVDWISFLNN